MLKEVKSDRVGVGKAAGTARYLGFERMRAHKKELGLKRPMGLRQRVGSQVGSLCIFLLLTIVSLVMLYPFAYMIFGAFRGSSGGGRNVGRFSMSAWKVLFAAIPVGRELLNSTLVCAGAIALIVVGSSLAGYGIAKTRFRGSGALLSLIVGAMMIPLQSVVIPDYVNMAQLGLINNYLSAILVYGALGMPFGTFLMTSYYKGLPDEVVEAARCDGLEQWGVFRRICFPMAKPAIATIVVLEFIQIWDEFMVGLLFLQKPSIRTITVGLGVLSSGRVVELPVLLAGSLLSALPAVVVYLFFQRYLVSGLTLGMSK